LDAWVIRQVAQPEIPELLVEPSFGGIAVLVESFEKSKNLLDPLASDL
jgi:hypothetical protein